MNSLRSMARRRSDSSCSRSVPTERKAGRNGSMRSPPKRLAWCMASSASLTMSSAVACAEVQVIRPIEAVSTISRLAKVIGALDRLLDGVGDGRDAGRVLLGQQHQRELVAGKARQRVASA